MPRQINVSLPSDSTDALVTLLQDTPGVTGIRVFKGASRIPSGDVVSLDAISRAIPGVAKRLTERGIGIDQHSSFSTSEPTSLVQRQSAEAIARDSSEYTWEEMQFVMAKESNMTANAMVVMLISGVLAAIGIATNALHIVIGAMLIAPGFEPIVRVALGVVGQGAAWRHGLLDIAKGYAALGVGAALTALILVALGKAPLEGDPSYLPAGVLVSYWTSISATSVIASVVAGVAGTILVATGRSVLTAGVMVALALIPGATITAMGLATGDFDIAAAGALRWAVDVAAVLSTAFAVLAWKRAAVHKRPLSS